MMSENAMTSENLTKESIVIIHDQDDIREWLKLTLSEQLPQYDFYSFVTDKEGLEHIRVTKPIMILKRSAAQVVESFDDDEMCKQLGSNLETVQIAFLFFVPYMPVTNRIIDLSLQCHDHITEPFDIEELALRIKHTINCTRRMFG